MSDFTVSHGWCRENHATFQTFADALAFYLTVAPLETYGARITSSDGDDEGDGLTRGERDQIDDADLLLDLARRYWLAKPFSVEEFSLRAELDPYPAGMVDRAIDVVSAR